jgi:hypothetical protein
MNSSPPAVHTRDRCRSDSHNGQILPFARELGASGVDAPAKSRRSSLPTPAQLQLSLWSDEPPVEGATRPTGTDAHHAPSGHDAVRTAGDGRVLWTDEAVRRLHVAVLHHALGVLKSKARGSTAEKYEVLRWIWAPAVFCWVIRVHGGVATRVPIYRRQLPFMFETCCAFDGQRPEVLRDLLEELLRPILKERALESLIT